MSVPSGDATTTLSTRSPSTTCAYAHVVEGDLVLNVVVASPDGTDMLRHTSATAELDVPGAERLGVRVAEDLLQMGAAALAGLDLK